MADVKLEKVVKSFGETRVIHGVDLDIEDGEFVVFVGPSGCGKSTLLRLISGLEEATSGKLHIGGQDVTNVEASDRGIAMVFQSYALYPHMSVEQNMGFGLKMTGTPANEIKRRVDEAAKILHLDQLLDRKPKQLSGGQRQRVAIGRAIVREPRVFLFDEPLSNLDAELRVQMRLEISKLHQDFESTMIYVTHDQVEAMTLADKIVVLRAGIIEQVGSPIDLYENPNNLFVAGFIGSPRMNFLKGRIVGAVDNGIRVAVNSLNDAEVTARPRGSSPGDGADVMIGIRPEHIQEPAEGLSNVDGSVEVVEQLGGVSYVYLSTPGGEPITVERKGHAQNKSGETTTIGLDPSRIYLFDGQEQRV